MATSSKMPTHGYQEEDGSSHLEFGNGILEQLHPALPGHVFFLFRARLEVSLKHVAPSIVNHYVRWVTFFLLR